MSKKRGAKSQGEDGLKKSTALKKGDGTTLGCHKSWRKIHPNAELSSSIKKLQKAKLSTSEKNLSGRIQNNSNSSKRLDIQRFQFNVY